MEERVAELKRQGDALFERRRSVESLWQDIADNFYPERADFTTTRSIGDEFAAHLTTSYPLLARRALGDWVGMSLRPTNEQWLAIDTTVPDTIDLEGRRWLEWAAERQYRAMYDRKALLLRAARACDHDFATFGQGVIQVGLNGTATALLYQNWHLRDVVWCENSEGAIDTVHRRWKPTARDLDLKFPGKVSAKVTQIIAQKKGYTETVECRHVIMPSRDYAPPSGRKKWRQPFVSIMFEADTGQVLEEIGSWTLKYVIPRWAIRGSTQYAHSPAVMAALPDARLLQAMTRTLLDAGAMAVRPPMIGQEGVVRSDLAVYDGGVTWVDAEYDERLGEALRPLMTKFDGIPLGLEMTQDVRGMIASAFFLDKINLPPPDREMTAYEVGQRMSQWLRQVLPLFEPIIPDYNGALCDETFETLKYAGAFGRPDEMPESLQEKDVEFRFRSPLTEATQERKSHKYQEAAGMLAQAVQVDPGAAGVVDVRTALRDALIGIGAPATWQRTEEQIAEMEANERENMQAEAQMQTAQQVVGMVEQGSKASANFAKAEAA